MQHARSAEGWGASASATLALVAATIALASRPSAAPVAKPVAATLVSADGAVDVAGASGKNGSTIALGSGVVTADNAHAEVALQDDWSAVLAPQTTFYVLGKAAPKGSKKLVVGDSTLVVGTVRVSVSSASAKAVPVDTPAGKVSLSASTEAKMHVEDGATRVSVHKGKATLGGLVIAEGSGVKIDKGKWTGKPAKLPDAPKWTAPPKASWSTPGDTPANVTGMIGGTASKWHFQVAMDVRFSEYLVDLQLKATTTTMVFEQKLPPGRYWVRVAALDVDGLESAWGPVASTTVTSVSVTVAKPKPKP